MVGHHPQDRLFAVRCAARPSRPSPSAGNYCQQHDSHGGREDDGGIDGKRPWPVGIREPRIAIGDQQDRERQRIGNDEQPHPSFFEPIANGDPPPDQGELRVESGL